MPRTTAQAVQGLLLSDYGSDSNGNLPSLTPFIATANVVVSRVATAATVKGVTLSSTELELIERWLAAHFYATSDRPYQSKGTQGANATFQGQTGMGLESTYYGQQAMIVDYSGALAALGRQQRAGAFWLGRPPSEQTDYLDRD